MGDRIAAVRPSCAMLAEGEVMHLGEVVLLPGFVNVHTHLELTALRGAVEDLPFFGWLRRLVELKGWLSGSAWEDSALWGAMEAAAAGVTTIADTTDSGASAQALVRVGLRGRVYQEVFAIQPHHCPQQVLEALEARLQSLHSSTQGSLVEVGVAPHAPYTVQPEMWYTLRQYTEQQGYPVCIHVAESEDEMAFWQEGAGPFAQMYRQRGIAWEVPRVHPIAFLHQGGWLREDTLLVHAVQTTAEHARLLADTQTAVAHCPQSNAKLYHGVAPLQEWMRLGLRVGLGTDSVVSNNTLDLFHEMRFAVLLQRALHRQEALLRAREALWLATMGGARALGWEHQIGSIEPGKQADLCAVALNRVHQVPTYDPYAAVVFASQADDVVMTMVAGRIVYQRGEYPLLGEPVEAVRSRLQAIVNNVSRRLGSNAAG